jgi:hypothetical protein
VDVGRDVAFTISDAAEAIIRERGGELWIWAGDDGKPCTSSGPPRLYRMTWTTYEPDGLAIRVDSRIVPPWQWRLTAVETEPRVAARWDGLDPRVFDRQPLEERRDARRYVVVAAVAVASALAVLWAMHFAQVTGEWLSVGHLVLTTALAIVGGAAWLRKKHVERRADKALEAELERSPLPLRTVGEDEARGGELG